MENPKNYSNANSRADNLPSFFTAMSRSWSLFKQLPRKTRWQLLAIYFVAACALLAFTQGFYAMVGYFVQQTL